MTAVPERVSMLPQPMLPSTRAPRMRETPAFTSVPPAMWTESETANAGSQRMSRQKPEDRGLETLRYWHVSISFLIYCLASHTPLRVVRLSPTLFSNPSFCWQVQAHHNRR